VDLVSVGRRWSGVRVDPWGLAAQGLTLCVLAGLLIGPWALGRVTVAMALALASVSLLLRLRLIRRISGLARQARTLVLASHGGDALDEGLSGFEQDLVMLTATVGTINHRLAHRHPLSSLPTREPLIARIRKDIDSGVASAMLAIFEFADFDRLNAFDSDTAECALMTLADRVSRMTGPNRMVAHVDRARLAVWLPHEDLEQAMRQIEAIGYALGDAITDAGAPLLPEIRTGVARLPLDGTSGAALLTRAFAQITLADVTGPASTDVPLDTAAIARHAFALEQDLRQAIARNQFELRFQPLIDAAARRVCGAEALLRWRHPDRGMIMPAVFIPVVEQAGLSEEIGLWVLNAACREARSWRRRGLSGLSVAVNLSAQQLQRDDLATLIERTVARHGLAPSALEIELTESVAAGDFAHTRAFFADLRALGVAVAIDDFGTGYSSLGYLKKLPFDKLKIDREFVTHVDQRPDSQAICQSIIALGRGLGIRVLAEGIERREEYDWLRRHGCTLFQGFYFAQPLEADAFTGFVRNRTHLAGLVGITPPDLQTRINDRMVS
jgi:EAL domain-containing protein (putative c-di-GMP-specific phosphodiesterase class I)/GGDEF domain-containing protein